MLRAELEIPPAPSVPRPLEQRALRPAVVVPGAISHAGQCESSALSYFKVPGLKGLSVFQYNSNLARSCLSSATSGSNESDKAGLATSHLGHVRRGTALMGTSGSCCVSFERCPSLNRDARNMGASQVVIMLRRS